MIAIHYKTFTLGPTCRVLSYTYSMTYSSGFITPDKTTISIISWHQMDTWFQWIVLDIPGFNGDPASIWDAACIRSFTVTACWSNNRITVVEQYSSAFGSLYQKSTIVEPWFLPCDAMHCTVFVIVILSVCPSVRLSHSCTVSTWFDLRSWFLHHMWSIRYDTRFAHESWLPVYVSRIKKLKMCKKKTIDNSRGTERTIKERKKKC